MEDSTETRLKSLDENKLMVIRKLFGTSFCFEARPAMVNTTLQPLCLFVTLFISCIFNFDHIRLSCVYTLRLIWPISYPGECDLMVHTRKHSVILSRMCFIQQPRTQGLSKIHWVRGTLYEVCSVVFLRTVL